MWPQTVKRRKTKQNNGQVIQEGKSNANVPGKKAQQTRLQIITRNTKKKCVHIYAVRTRGNHFRSKVAKLIGASQ